MTEARVVAAEFDREEGDEHSIRPASLADIVGQNEQSGKLQEKKETDTDN